MLAYPLAAAARLGAQKLVVVIGRDADQVEAAFAGEAQFVVQAEQRGTGHAVQVALPKLAGSSGDVLVLYGDTPLLRTETLARMQAKRRESGAPLVILTSPEPLPGLVVRGAGGRVERIVEQTDATPEEREIREGNTGVYLCDAALLASAVAELAPKNAQGELYLTDVVAIARARPRGRGDPARRRGRGARRPCSAGATSRRTWRTASASSIRRTCTSTPASRSGAIPRSTPAW
jgi:bifunctional UDP-N-acetylglucosamine pyrophosphorylase/glucosamine-1-phosphate N-acetyltransferase